MAAGQYSDYLFVTGFGFSIPTGSSINGIKVTIERNDGSGKIKDNLIKILKSGSVAGSDKSASAGWQSSDQIVTYGSASDLWGTTWSASDVNASNFGIAISVKRNNGAGTNVAYIDHIQITVDYSAPLPIELVDFNSQIISNNTVSLNWTTATEINNDHFEIERSSSMSDFISIGEVKGAGNSVLEQQYSFKDNSPLTGMNYYRLKQIDFDGKFSYSPVIAVKTTSTIHEVQLFPNPCSSAFTLIGDDILNHDISIFNITGSVVKSISYYDGSTIDISTLVKGTYFVFIHSDSNQPVIQLTIL